MEKSDLLRALPGRSREAARRAARFSVVLLAGSFVITSCIPQSPMKAPMQPSIPHLTAPMVEVLPVAPPPPVSVQTAPAPPSQAHESQGWQPPDLATRPFRPQVEQWRGLVRELVGEAWEQGRLEEGAAKLDDDLVLAVIQQESEGNPNAYSWAGAMGLMQVMPGTFAHMMEGDDRLAPLIPTENFWDERSNIRAGIRYLAWALHFHDNLYWALASYNAGIGNVRRWRAAGLDAVPPVGGFVETAEYAQVTLRNYLSRRPDVDMYVPAPMPPSHVPGALRLLARV